MCSSFKSFEVVLSCSQCFVTVPYFLFSFLSNGLTLFGIVFKLFLVCLILLVQVVS